jgi:hypothetical protein
MLPPPEPVTQAKEPPKEVIPVGYSLHGGHDQPVKRRSFADITAAPCFAHAGDYTWLSGELQYVYARNVWTVRFASVDEEDRYGGSVTLQPFGPMTEYKSGQYVRVEGQLVDAESHEPSPLYRVRSIQVISQQ